MKPVGVVSTKQRMIAAVVRYRRRLPAWVDRLIERVLASSSWPASALKSFLAAGPPVPPPVVADPTAPVRLLIAPYNYAGQAWQWARALERTAVREERISARSVALSTGGNLFPADLVIPANVFLGSAAWHAAWADALHSYTHVVIESFGSLLGRGGGDALLAEIAELRARGTAVALLCHGSDIRSPRAHTARHRNASIDDWGPNADRLERAAAAGATVISAFDGFVFVSTPDLLDDVPAARWLPVVVDPAPWRAASESLARAEGEAPVVVHAPSNAGLKGTQFIDPVCRTLHDEGVIRFRALRAVPAENMPLTIAEADIVIDQLLVGSYGVAACEAMAAGKVVVGDVSASVRARIEEHYAATLPIVQADRHDLEQVMRRLIDSPDERARLGVAGQAFVDRVHSGAQTRVAMGEFLGFQRG